MRKYKQKSMYYNICPNCGASLDPGEKCNCKGGRVKDSRYPDATVIRKKQKSSTDCPAAYRGGNYGFSI